MSDYPTTRTYALFSATSGRRPIKFSLIHKRLRIFRGWSRLGARRNAVHRAQHDQLCRALLCVLAAEQIAQDRNIPQPRHFAVLVSYAIVHEPGDHEALAILQLKLRLRAACTQSRHGKSGNGERVSEIKLTHFRHYLEMNIVVGHDHGRKFQLYAELAKLNRDRGKALARLDDGKGKFAARKETRLFSIHRDEIWFG